VAKTRFRVAPDSTFGQLRGRLDFMAPEQAQSDSLDRRADLWSVGASLYYLLAGHGPFGACEGSFRLRRLMMGAPPLPPPPGTHPAVARVLAGCLARRPEDRFPTAEHLGWAIEEAIDTMGVAAAARDVAELLAERGHRPGAKTVVTGACAIPRDMTLLRPDTVSNLRPTRKRAVAWPSQVRRSLAAFACVTAIGLAATGATRALEVGTRAGPAAASLGVAPRVPARFEEASALPGVVTPRVEAPPGHATRPHTRPHPAHPVRSKAKPGHDGLGGSP
jgi:hypothetical protein